MKHAIRLLEEAKGAKIAAWAPFHLPAMEHTPLGPGRLPHAQL
jgi:hypothetical protein